METKKTRKNWTPCHERCETHLVSLGRTRWTRTVASDMMGGWRDGQDSKPCRVCGAPTDRQVETWAVVK